MCCLGIDDTVITSETCFNNPLPSNGFTCYNFIVFHRLKDEASTSFSPRPGGTDKRTSFTKSSLRGVCLLLCQEMNRVRTKRLFRCDHSVTASRVHHFHVLSRTAEEESSSFSLNYWNYFFVPVLLPSQTSLGVY
jgi:hypothetical protein